MQPASRSAPSAAAAPAIPLNKPYGIVDVKLKPADVSLSSFINNDAHPSSSTDDNDECEWHIAGLLAPGVQLVYKLGTDHSKFLTGLFFQQVCTLHFCNLPTHVYPRICLCTICETTAYTCASGNTSCWG
jgi:hypothetical protein